jgi:hypothetical protein
VPSVSRERGQVATQPAGVQPWQPVATASAAEKNRHLVADELAAAVGKDRWAPGEACTVLLADVGGGSSNPTPIQHDAPADLGAAGPNRLNARQTKLLGKKGSGHGVASQETPRNGSFNRLHIDTSPLQWLQE